MSEREVSLAETIGAVFLRTVEGMERWAQSRSMWPLMFGSSCCAVEMMHAASSRIDLDRFGCLFRPSPRQADLLIVAGTVTRKLAPQVQNLYSQMLAPRWVIAMGNCAISGGIYQGTESVIGGVEEIIPVDEYVTGCPPKPEDLAFAILHLQEKIRKLTLS
jgi:NADH-quinone oxidoreductase subunit B